MTNANGHANFMKNYKLKLAKIATGYTDLPAYIPPGAKTLSPLKTKLNVSIREKMRGEKEDRLAAEEERRRRVNKKQEYASKLRSKLTQVPIPSSTIAAAAKRADETASRLQRMLAKIRGRNAAPNFNSNNSYDSDGEEGLYKEYNETYHKSDMNRYYSLSHLLTHSLTHSLTHE
jgi:hypothetical protein